MAQAMPRISIHRGESGYMVGLVLPNAPLWRGKPRIAGLGHVTGHVPLAVGDRIDVREQGSPDQVAVAGHGLAMYATNPVRTYTIAAVETSDYAYIYTLA